MKLWNFKGEQRRITEALQLSVPAHAVISLTGAGGKTTLLFAWAHELASSGRRTVITTTTHMMHPDIMKDMPSNSYSGVQVVYSPSDEADQDYNPDVFDSAVGSALDQDRIVMVVSEDPDRPNKVKSPPSSVFSRLLTMADVLLIEADGSRRMPIKWPAPWEPAVPDNTDITVCVAGLSALGRPVSDVMYGAEFLPESMKSETVDERLFYTALAALEGGQKGSLGEFRVFLNQADNESLRLSASRLQKILGVYGIQSAWGSLREQ